MGQVFNWIAPYYKWESYSGNKRKLEIAFEEREPPKKRRKKNEEPSESVVFGSVNNAKIPIVLQERYKEIENIEVQLKEKGFSSQGTCIVNPRNNLNKYEMNRCWKGAIKIPMKCNDIGGNIFKLSFFDSADVY